MSVDKETVRRIAFLARLTLREDETERMCEEINALLTFDQHLNAVDVEGIEPLVSVIEKDINMREDKILDGNKAEAIIANAPLTEENFFLVPKVVD